MNGGPWGSPLERWRREAGDPILDYGRAIGAEEGCACMPLHYAARALRALCFESQEGVGPCQ